MLAQPERRQPPDITQLNDFLWLAPSAFLNYNSGIVISNGEACLIDPGITPDEVERIAAFLQREGAALRTILLTHSHWDHILGPEHLPEAPIVTHEAYLQQVTSYNEQIQQSIGRWEQQLVLVRTTPFTIPTPSSTFTDQLTISVGAIDLHLIAVPGHAADQFAVYEAETQTFWAADMFSDLEIPFVSQSLGMYQYTIDRLNELPIALLIPGHGNPTDNSEAIADRVWEDREYLAELRSEVAQAIGSGYSIEETVQACIAMLKSYHHTGDNTEEHKLNIESAYIELGGVTDGQAHGWARVT
ncbi:MBL fold metallo-hydrolase [Candidatus Gracilibacteria bacterium]|nr:MBL fold metallo-hydrolase [Candidatus Gracilibacteria bacterium]